MKHVVWLEYINKLFVVRSRQTAEYNKWFTASLLRRQSFVLLYKNIQRYLFYYSNASPDTHRERKRIHTADWSLVVGQIDVLARQKALARFNLVDIMKKKNARRHKNSLRVCPAVCRVKIVSKLTEIEIFSPIDSRDMFWRRSYDSLPWPRFDSRLEKNSTAVIVVVFLFHTSSSSSHYQKHRNHQIETEIASIRPSPHTTKQNLGFVLWYFLSDAKRMKKIMVLWSCWWSISASPVTF